MVKPVPVNPPSLGPPIGYAHGMRSGSLLFVAGQIGGRPSGDGRRWTVEGDLVSQFEGAVRNVLEVVRAAGAGPEDVVEMTVFVKDLEAYRRGRHALGEAWRRTMGRHYPAMTLVEVSDLYEPGALVEIRAVATVG